MGERYDLQNVVSALRELAYDIRENLVVDGEVSVPGRLESVGNTLNEINEREQYFGYLLDCLKQEAEVIEELMYSDQSSDNPTKVKRR